MIDYVLEIDGLTKTYGRKTVLNDVDIKIEKGQIYGFIGKNGAGKTTVIKLIAGLSNPESGSIKLFGSSNLNEGRKKIGLVVENPALYPYMSARQNIDVQRIMKGVKDKKVTDELLEIVGLKGVGNKKSKNFSLGMKQRLAIALALVGNPEFLVLDEPINGLDPAGIKEFRELMLKLKNEAGTTILISSHILGELSKIADKYGVICNGEMAGEFTAEELKEKLRTSVKFGVNDVEKASMILKEQFDIDDVEIDGDTLVVYDSNDRYQEISKTLEENDIIISSFSINNGDYEDYFIKLMEGEKKHD